MSREAFPAAGVLPGAVVRMSDGSVHAGRLVTVKRIHNSDPVPGRIRWETDLGDVPVGGTEPVEVIEF